MWHLYVNLFLSRSEYYQLPLTKLAVALIALRGMDGDKISFRIDWTHFVISKLEDAFVCVLYFKYKKINKMCSRMHSMYYKRAKAVCKFHNCLIYYFIIKNYPILFNANATIELEYTSLMRNDDVITE